MRGTPLEAVFFDLDGTLVDTAPDLIVAMQRLRAERGAAPADVAAVGTAVSKGGRAMLRRGFPDADDALIEELLPRFLELYSEAIATHSTMFPGIDGVLETLEARDVRWGIVTNKPGWLARALLAALKLDVRCAAMVSGDCLPQKKPDPAPILRACTLASVEPARSIYVGDDVRDIEAGRNAGMRTIAAGWGYLDGADPNTWGADLVLATPAALLPALGFA
jgi:phosphoglycolate phosphatase